MQQAGDILLGTLRLMAINMEDGECTHLIRAMRTHDDRGESFSIASGMASTHLIALKSGRLLRGRSSYLQQILKGARIDLAFGFEMQKYLKKS